MSRDLVSSDRALMLATECGNCRRYTRDDLAPSPNPQFTSGYSFIGTAKDLRRTECHRCNSLYEGICHFAHMFRSGENFSPDLIAIQCSGYYNEVDIKFGFQDTPTMRRIELRASDKAPIPACTSRSAQISKSIKSIQAWLDMCNTDHGRHQCIKPQPPVLPTRLLKIKANKVRVIEAQRGTNSTDAQSYGRGASYVALSHCWGADETNLKLVKANMASMLRGIAIASLPQTFKDAVFITRQIGISLLWIDSLCIIQDDPMDWEFESARMSLIYSNAYLTISATCSHNGLGGCFAPIRDTPYICQSEVPGSQRRNTYIRGKDLWSPKRAKSNHYGRSFVSEFGYTFTSSSKYWFTLRPSHDIRELSHRGEYGEYGQEIISMAYPLLSRAWYFQERLLSPRIVHFGRTELVWECQGSFLVEHLESHHGGKWSKDKDETMRPFRFFRARLEDKHGSLGDFKGRPDPNPMVCPFEATRKRFVSFMKHTVPDVPEDAKKLDNRLARGFSMALWNMLVEEYTRLGLTRDADRLPALSGIASSIASTTMKQTGTLLEYIAGLWSQHLPAALFWTSSLPNRRPTTYRAPSFSWASVEGPISFCKPLTEKRLIDGENSNLIGYTVCSVVNCEASSGIDPYGRVTAGSLQVQAWTCTANVKSLYFEPNTGRTICEVSLSNDNTNDVKTQKFRTDVPLRLCALSPAEVQPSENILLVLLECSKLPPNTGSIIKDSLYPHAYRVISMAMRPSVRVEGAWERFGLIHPADDVLLYFSGSGKGEADVGAGASVFDEPGLWFTEKEVVTIV